MSDDEGAEGGPLGLRVEGESAVGAGFVGDGDIASGEFDLVFQGDIRGAGDGDDGGGGGEFPAGIEDDGADGAGVVGDIGVAEVESIGVGDEDGAVAGFSDDGGGEVDGVGEECGFENTL